MIEVYPSFTPPEQKSAEFLVCPDCHDFSPEKLEYMQLILAQHNVDLETTEGIQLLVGLSRSLYPANDPDHGWGHIQNVIWHSHNLANIYNISLEEYYALISAACLHDVIRYGVNNPAVLSAEMAESVLAPHMRPKTIQLTTDAIAQHSSGIFGRYSDNRVTQLIYDADKGDTNRFRWQNCGLNPRIFTETPIENEYDTYLDLVLGTVSTSYTKKIIMQKIEELEALKNAGAHML